MKAKILIVEDQFVEANNLRLMLERAGYKVCTIARSVPIALKIIEKEHPELVLLDILLQGELTGIDLAKSLRAKNIAFVYLSANSNKPIFALAKATKPYGFLVKPFRDKDVLVMLDVAWYLHQEQLQNINQKKVVTPVDNTDRPSGLDYIITESMDMLRVLTSVKTVASTDTSVLILGESGTGKELIARGIHQASQRASKPFIIVNCAALPQNLIESELFGHEKGSFTGAFNKRIGKFEQANEGTIFLDEIGELSLELQVKFLRVLQEKEIERIGGQTKKINVRVIAATNRDLEEEILVGRFRMDLYYRLNVFPILLPPLRERKEDILLLARHFIKFYSNREGKKVIGMSEQAAKEMVNHSWPGNVRELENLIERSVLMATGPKIEYITLSKGVQKPELPEDDPEKMKTMEEHVRDYILTVLKRCNWKIYGKGGAAEILGMNVSTLNSRIKKLGIK
ncbi:sigma-54 dependent transcriptional regulator [Mucilaginibacter sp.]|uniref:sigma-54-dependent transcriptional regulator n=1 Tax=Mucilaginibacter sp. TaxID=1882438 RepID=UPI00261F2E4B|nr:sigma-54 dependent transcriptional regulator [Mucilaginibacter sp.]MDB4922952.1 response regulator [Mucilaginibacter sp.]